MNYAILDIGTTSLRCFIYNPSYEIISTASRNLEILIPHFGYNEIDHEKLFADVVYVIRESVENANISYSQIVLGISVQRSSFITWSKSTGKYFHNIITWKDIRADGIVNSWNQSMTLGAIKFSAKCIHSITRSARFLAGSVMKMMNSQVAPRLMWAVQNIPELQEASKRNDAVMGTIDSYLLQRLREGTVGKKVEPMMEITNATVTLCFDPYQLQWANWVISLFSLKASMFPKVVDNSHDYGDIHESYFGVPIKIVAVMGDQPASMFGNCCFEKGDAKVTLGTGTFLNINTANKCHASVLGLYPLVAWKLRDQKVCYSVEAQSADTATIINWGVQIGLYSEPAECGGLAESVDSSNGVFFIPAFSGLSAPINDFTATSGFIGVTVNTTRAHMTRALLESIVFRVAQLLHASEMETDYRVKVLRIDGGVSKCDFVCQSLADLCQITVERSVNVENTSLGIAFLCAYNLKLETMESLKKSYKSGKKFHPRKELHAMWKTAMENWEVAVERFKHWY